LIADKKEAALIPPSPRRSHPPGTVEDRLWSARETADAAYTGRTYVRLSKPRGGNMAQTSPIEWTEATWNPTTGCDSPGCDNCYALTLASATSAAMAMLTVRSDACS
jgi:hypothetical protein